jgi:hypothetical protein
MIDGFTTEHVWFGDRIVFVKRRYGFVLSVRAFGEYNRVALIWGRPFRWHASRGEQRKP